MTSATPGSANSQLVKSPLAVEKLLPAKFAKIKSRQDVSDAIFVFAMSAEWFDNGLIVRHLANE